MGTKETTSTTYPLRFIYFFFNIINLLDVYWADIVRDYFSLFQGIIVYTKHFGNYLLYIL